MSGDCADCCNSLHSYSRENKAAYTRNFTYFAFDHYLHLAWFYNVETVGPVALQMKTASDINRVIIKPNSWLIKTEAVKVGMKPVWLCALHLWMSGRLKRPRSSSSLTACEKDKRDHTTGTRHSETAVCANGTSRDFRRATDSMKASYILLFFALFLTISLWNVARSCEKNREQALKTCHHPHRCHNLPLLDSPGPTGHLPVSPRLWQLAACCT